jgi:putative holliday junction resolvase
MTADRASTTQGGLYTGQRFRVQPSTRQMSQLPASSKVAPRGAIFEVVEDFSAALAPGTRLIGIDLGTKTIGLALSDVTRTIATPLETIRRVKFTPDVARLLAITAEHGITGLVLGLPVNMDGSEGPRAQATRAFARNLNKLSALPILLWDERLSTTAAERTLIEADTSRKRRAEVIDKMAAGIILQGALDRMRHRAAD